MVCPFLVERPVSHRLQEWRARRYWSLWFVGKVPLLNLFRSAFRVRDIEFYFTQHVSSITVEQRWHFPGCFQSVLCVQINSSLTHTKENCLRCVNVCPSIKRGGGSSVSYEAWVFFNQRIWKIVNFLKTEDLYMDKHVEKYRGEKGLGSYVKNKIWLFM